MDSINIGMLKNHKGEIWISKEDLIFPFWLKFLNDMGIKEMNTGLPFKMISVLPSTQEVRKIIYKCYIHITSILTLVTLFIMTLQSFLICWVIPTIFIICIGLIKIHIFRENKDRMVKELQK